MAVVEICASEEMMGGVTAGVGFGISVLGGGEALIDGVAAVL